MTRKRSRPCPGGCGRPAEAGLYVCGECWRDLPPSVQRRLTSTWRAVERVAAADEVDGLPIEIAMHVATVAPATFRAYMSATAEADTLLQSRMLL